METVTDKHFKENMTAFLEQAIRHNELISISTEEGNAILISEQEYNDMMETVYLSSLPKMQENSAEGTDGR